MLILYLYLNLVLVCICTFVSLYIQCGFPLRQCRSLVRRTVNVFEPGLIHTDRTLKVEMKKDQKNCVLSMFLFVFHWSCHRIWVMETQAIIVPYHLEYHYLNEIFLVPKSMENWTVTSWKIKGCNFMIILKLSRLSRGHFSETLELWLATKVGESCWLFLDWSK